MENPSTPGQARLHTEVVSETIEKPRVEQTRHEGAALGWLTFGLILAELGAFIGTYLVLRSNVWSWRWKAAALALPLVLVLGVKMLPDLGSDLLTVTLVLAAIVAAAWASYGLLRVADRGRDQPRLGRISAAVVAAFGVVVASVVFSQIHAIGSYDYRNDAIAIAQTAEDAGEKVEVIQDDSEWIHGDRPSRASVEARVETGNERFAALFDKASDRAEWETPQLSTAELGDCYVFPVVIALNVTSTADSMETVSSLARFCYGPSSYSGSVALTDR